MFNDRNDSFGHQGEIDGTSCGDDNDGFPEFIFEAKSFLKRRVAIFKGKPQDEILVDWLQYNVQTWEPYWTLPVDKKEQLGDYKRRLPLEEDVDEGEDFIETDGDTYTVEKVLFAFMKHGREYFYIKWEHYAIAESTWGGFYDFSQPHEMESEINEARERSELTYQQRTQVLLSIEGLEDPKKRKRTECIDSYLSTTTPPKGSFEEAVGDSTETDFIRTIQRKRRSRRVIDESDSDEPPNGSPKFGNGPNSFDLLEKPSSLSEPTIKEPIRLQESSWKENSDESVNVMMFSAENRAHQVTFPNDSRNVHVVVAEVESSPDSAVVSKAPEDPSCNYNHFPNAHEVVAHMPTVTFSCNEEIPESVPKPREQQADEPKKHNTFTEVLSATSSPNLPCSANCQIEATSTRQCCEKPSKKLKHGSASMTRHENHTNIPHSKKQRVTSSCIPDCLVVEPNFSEDPKKAKGSWVSPAASNEKVLIDAPFSDGCKEKADQTLQQILGPRLDPNDPEVLVTIRDLLGRLQSIAPSQPPSFNMIIDSLVSLVGAIEQHKEMKVNGPREKSSTATSERPSNTEASCRKPCSPPNASCMPESVASSCSVAKRTCRTDRTKCSQHRSHTSTAATNCGTSSDSSTSQQSLVTGWSSSMEDQFQARVAVVSPDILSSLAPFIHHLCSSSSSGLSAASISAVPLPLSKTAFPPPQSSSTRNNAVSDRVIELDSSFTRIHPPSQQIDRPFMMAHPPSLSVPLAFQRDSLRNGARSAKHSPDNDAETSTTQQQLVEPGNDTFFTYPQPPNSDRQILNRAFETDYSLHSSPEGQQMVPFRLSTASCVKNPEKAGSRKRNKKLAQSNKNKGRLGDQTPHDLKTHHKFTSNEFPDATSQACSNVNVEELHNCSDTIPGQLCVPQNLNTTDVSVPSLGIPERSVMNVKSLKQGKWKEIGLRQTRQINFLMQRRRNKSFLDRGFVRQLPSQRSTGRRSLIQPPSTQSSSMRTSLGRSQSTQSLRPIHPLPLFQPPPPPPTNPPPPAQPPVPQQGRIVQPRIAHHRRLVEGHCPDPQELPAAALAAQMPTIQHITAERIVLGRQHLSQAQSLAQQAKQVTIQCGTPQEPIDHQQHSLGPYWQQQKEGPNLTTSRRHPQLQGWIQHNKSKVVSNPQALHKAPLQQISQGQLPCNPRRLLVGLQPQSPNFPPLEEPSSQIPLHLAGVISSRGESAHPLTSVIAIEPHIIPGPKQPQKILQQPLARQCMEPKKSQEFLQPQHNIATSLQSRETIPESRTICNVRIKEPQLWTELRRRSGRLLDRSLVCYRNAPSSKIKQTIACYCRVTDVRSRNVT